MKKLTALTALISFGAIATPAHALSMMSLHALPASVGSAQTNMVIVALAATALAGTLAFRISKS